MPDQPTFDERFAALAAISYRVAFRLLGDRHEAENLAQEALARAYVRWNRIRTYDEAWVTRVTTNLAIGFWRHHRRTERGESDQPATVDHMAERMDLSRALRRLPRRQRQVLALRYLADLSESETADRLGCTVGTVKQHASRGLRAMRGALASWEADPKDAAVDDCIEEATGVEPC